MKTLTIMISALAVTKHEIRSHLSVDRVVLMFACLMVLFAAPLIPRAAHDPRMLATLVVHEPILTMALDAMTVWPFGDPGNFFSDYGRLPDYWHNFKCGLFFYYGGAYLDIAFLFFGPLKWLGLPTFPAAPIILRTVSLMAGLLSCIILYNFGRRHSGKWAGILGVFILFTDSGFRFYTVIIHPDTLQLLMALAVLVLAARHSEEGDCASLAAVGVLAGMFHGIKFGGPWIIPMLIPALYWGWQAHSDKAQGTGVIGPAGRVFLILTTFAAGFFLTTPYALSPTNHYWISLKKLHLELSFSSVAPINLRTWIDAVIDHRGVWTATAMFVSVCALLLSPLRRDCNKALVLAAVLATSNVMWYSLMGKLYVVPSYFIAAYGLAGLLLGHCIARLLKTIAEHAATFAKPAFCVVLLCFIPLGVKQLALALELFLTGSNYEKSTHMKIGRWASSHIPTDSSILMDRSAYFDPSLFPNQRSIGETVRYVDVVDTQCDYLVLSSAVYEAPHYAALRNHGNDALTDLNPFSMSLYERLGCYDPNPSFPGPTTIPGIELLHVFQQSDSEKETAADSAPHGVTLSAASSDWSKRSHDGVTVQGERKPLPAFVSALASGFAREVSGINADMTSIVGLLRKFVAEEKTVWGPRLHLYKVDRKISYDYPTPIQYEKASGHLGISAGSPALSMKTRPLAHPSVFFTSLIQSAIASGNDSELQDATNAQP